MDMGAQIRQALARGYCSKENEHKILDPDLIEAMTRELLDLFIPARRMDCIKCGEIKHINDFATPDECNDCFAV